MKKHSILLFSLLSLIIFSCKKDNATDSNKQVFLINGVSDLTIEPNGTTAMGLEVRQVSGTQSTVNLSVSGIPANVTSSFSSTSGTPTFGSSLSFSANGAAVGTYTIKLSGNNGVESKDYNFNLHVKAPEDCTAGLIGNKSSTENCSESGTISPYDVTISKALGFHNRLLITNFGGFNQRVNAYVDLNCNTGSVTLPLQTIEGYTFTGSGTFSGGTLSIDYSVSASGYAESCTAIIQ